MRRIVEIVACRRIGDAGRIAADDVSVDAGGSASARVPLHLGRSGVEHRRRKDGENRPAAIEDARIEHRLMLPHANGERHVVVLRPAAERMQQEHRIFVFAQQHFARFAHEQRVAVVNRIAELEGENRVAAALDELVVQLDGRLAIRVEAVVVANALKHLEVAADEPVTAVEHKLDARMALVDGAELTRCALALSVRVDLDVAQSGDGFALVDEPHMRRRLAARLLLVVDGENDRQRLVDHRTHRKSIAALLRALVCARCVVCCCALDLKIEELAEVQRLQVLALTHKAGQRRRPAFG